jgi:hypothetical protein
LDLARRRRWCQKDGRNGQRGRKSRHTSR